MEDEIKIEKIIPKSEVSPTPENIQSPEKKAEQIRPIETSKNEIVDIPVASSAPAPAPVAIPATDQDQIILHKVESILSQGMERIYLSMDAGTQSAFKIKGEETSKKISGLFKHTKVQIKEVINLIVAWLRIVPQVNKYYIEQEAKIKADAIMEIYNKK